MIWYDTIYSTVIGLTPGASSTVHIYTQTAHRTTQLTTLVERLSGIRTQSGQTKVNEEINTFIMKFCARCVYIYGIKIRYIYGYMRN